MTYSSYLAHTHLIFKDLTLVPLDKLFTDRMSIIMFVVEYELLHKSMIQMFPKVNYLCVNNGGISDFILHVYTDQ